jgi:hypothetical protein
LPSWVLVVATDIYLPLLSDPCLLNASSVFPYRALVIRAPRFASLTSAIDSNLVLWILNSSLMPARLTMLISDFGPLRVVGPLAKSSRSFISHLLLSRVDLHLYLEDHPDDWPNDRPNDRPSETLGSVRIR